MPVEPAPARRNTLFQQLGTYRPRVFTQKAWWHFDRNRRASLLRRIGGRPDERQAFIIQQMVLLEWQKFELEAKAKASVGRESVEFLRLSAEYARQLVLLDRELANHQPAAVKRPNVAPRSQRAVSAQRALDALK